MDVVMPVIMVMRMRVKMRETIAVVVPVTALVRVADMTVRLNILVLQPAKAGAERVAQSAIGHV